jgi:dGTPase
VTSIAETSRLLKGFLYAKVYNSDALGGHRQQSMAMIAELFQFFLDYPERLPQAYAEQTWSEPAHRVVCDYIAGMTDVFFQRTYEQTIGAA